MNKKKETIKKDKVDIEKIDSVNLDASSITTANELRDFLIALKERITEDSAPAIYVVTAMNYIMSTTSIFSLLNEESKELARDIWLRLQGAGLQLRKPPMLFGEV